MSLVPEREFKACVDRYNGNYRARNFSCKDQFLVMSCLYSCFTGRCIESQNKRSRNSLDFSLGIIYSRLDLITYNGIVFLEVTCH
ncbi:MAG: DUF4372 domain-containing protein [Prevotella sp.]|nr:DUF4372 domain-containing protein [Prevotella sp.]